MNYSFLEGWIFIMSLSIATISFYILYLLRDVNVATGEGEEK